MTSFTHDDGRLAETYDRVSDLQFEGGLALVERLGIGEGARVLDVGCGTGRLAHWIAERVGSNGAAIGIDPVEERIHFARSRGSRATFEVGRAEDLRAFDDASFDAVCMSSVLHWVADKPKAFAEARRVLRPGGRLGATTIPRELSNAGTVGEVLESLLARADYAGRIDRSMLTSAARGCTTTELVSFAALKEAAHRERNRFGCDPSTPKRLRTRNALSRSCGASTNSKSGSCRGRSRTR
jgi:ubiquinone/menaquinone biosynthesis C-methylase UbiE